MSQWSNMIPVSERVHAQWMDPHFLSDIRRLCRKVAARTGWTAWIDLIRAELCFGFNVNGECRIPLSFRLFKDPGRSVRVRFDPATEPWHEDEIVRAYQLSRLPQRIKDRWASHWETSQKSDEKTLADSKIDETYRRASDMTERQYVKHSMGRHYRGRAAVSGLKE